MSFLYVNRGDFGNEYNYLLVDLLVGFELIYLYADV